MIDLRPPATGTEAYLAAILEELRAIRVALGDGGQEQGHVDDRFPAAGGVGPATSVALSPVKRTRTRTRGAAT